MPKTYVQQKEIRLAGISVRTTNAEEAGPNGRLPGLWDRYFRERETIAAAAGENGTSKNALYALYSDYESDATGAYTVIIGHEQGTEKAGDQELHESGLQYTDLTKSGLLHAVIPASEYIVFETRRGPVQTVVAEAWGQIWAYFEDAQEKRAFTGDYELYDLRDFDPGNAVVSIYIAVQS